jgi:AraC-like DNA-binding protein
MHLIPRHTEALNLLTNYARPLLDDQTLATPDLRRLVVAHVHDLIALALGATRDAADVARCGGVQAARLRSARAYIMENSGNQNLSIAMVAAHLGVSPRYLQKLFENEDCTFSAFLLGQRLVQAHRMLTSPKFDQCKVSAIAYDAGFGDLSYFNRCFRRRYGATPRDVREAAAE